MIKFVDWSLQCPCNLSKAGIIRHIMRKSKKVRWGSEYFPDSCKLILNPKTRTLNFNSMLIQLHFANFLGL